MDRPVIRRIADTEEELKRLEEELNAMSDSRERRLVLSYPTVYIHNAAESGKYEVYIGETNDIMQRTRQHFQGKKNPASWQYRLMGRENPSLYIIGHRLFNKSLTLDIENRLMHYLLGVEKVGCIDNGRGNEQDQYYTSDQFDEVFRGIWRDLGKHDPELFPAMREIEDSAIFKASPFHKLTAEQRQDKTKILEIIRYALEQQDTGQLVFVSGEAGTGKTVLISNLFYELVTAKDRNGNPYNCHLVVNHDEMLKVYKGIVEKLQLRSKDKDIATKATTLITKYLDYDDRESEQFGERRPEKELIDVVLVDEAHLLWSQGKQAYKGKNQLEDLRKIARVTVIMFDEDQALHTQEYWDPDYVDCLRMEAVEQQKKRLMSYYFELKNQLRIRGNPETVRWIRNLTSRLKIDSIPADDTYEIRVFDNPGDMEMAIRRKAANKETLLSRLLATFDWEYIDKKQPADGGTWDVVVGDWKRPWNLQLPVTDAEGHLLSGKKARKIKDQAWAEQPQTIGEVGSTFTIQGFDLNYAGVILGPSVKYRDGKIVIDPSCSKDKKAVQRRTIQKTDETGRSRMEKINNSETFIRNEINVLLTRGVNGLYLYAVDDALREALKQALPKPSLSYAQMETVKK